MPQTTEPPPARPYYAPFGHYFTGGRVNSYAHQIKAALEQKPASILEVGKGSGMVAAALRTLGIKVTTLDIQRDLEPDVVGSVTAIPLPGAAFDVTLCCQVLEHLPFEDFSCALVELRRVTTGALVLSLPDDSRYYSVDARLPFNLALNWNWSPVSVPARSFPSSKRSKMGHFWEIGYRGTSLRNVTAEIRGSGWLIEKTWRVPELSWHRFFVLK